jgi:hypothetical protein
VSVVKGIESIFADSARVKPVYWCYACLGAVFFSAEPSEDPRYLDAREAFLVAANHAG